MEKFLKNVLLLIMLFVMSPACAESNSNTADNGSEFDWSSVMEAIIQVESEGDPKAKSGNSVGVMQITPVLVTECNNILRSRKSKRRYKLSDRFSIAKSKEMFLLIQSKYNPMNSVERAIRSWNGGVHFSVQRTQRYFEKVLSAMK
ncbi:MULTISPECIES: lytic transglycosylase domain-containing protein [Prevotellaceae]|nr:MULTISPECIES: lytic transglycosylase domain-containing protein [Prevotellaceae]AGB27838.1 transglycosylase family protein [Prevotella dentalis DSM 3688]